MNISTQNFLVKMTVEAFQINFSFFFFLHLLLLFFLHRILRLYWDFKSQSPLWQSNFEIQRSKQKDSLLIFLLSYVRGSCQGTESLQRRKQNLEHEGRSGRLVEKGRSNNLWWLRRKLSIEADWALAGLLWCFLEKDNRI